MDAETYFWESFNMASLESITRFGINNRINTEGYPPESLVQKAADMQERIKAICLSYANGEIAIRGDSRLTAEGHAEKIKELGRKSLDQLTQIDTAVMGRIQEKLNKIALTMQIARTDEQDVPTILREQEIRRFLLTLNKLDRSNEFINAIKSGDQLVFSAFINAPSMFNMVNEQVRAEGLRLWGERTNPQATKEYRDLDIASKSLAENLADATQGIATVAGLIDDTLRARLQGMAAKGMQDAAQSRNEPHALVS
jgi:hypothetical protein